MKKHFIALLSMMMCFVLSVGIFTACDTETEVPKKYTISFYDGDELVDTIETYGNEEISMPAAPKKEGFTFKGWFSDKGIWKDELTKDTFVGQVLTEDVNVYAYYLENETPVASEYTITFYIDGEAVDSIETSGNERLTLLDENFKSRVVFRFFLIQVEQRSRYVTDIVFALQHLDGRVDYGVFEPLFVYRRNGAKFTLFAF